MASAKEDENTNASVLLLHAADGNDWAGFLSSWLSSPQYNIKSRLVDINNVPEPPASNVDDGSSSLLSSVLQSLPSESLNSTFTHLKSDFSADSSTNNNTNNNDSKNYLDQSSSEYETAGAVYTNDCMSPDLPTKSPTTESPPSSCSNLTTSSAAVLSAVSNSNDNDDIYENDVFDNNSNNNNNDNDKNDKNENNKLKQKNIITKRQHGISTLVDENRVCAILISPDIIEDEIASSFFVDLNKINEKTTVFLFLGVDLAELMTFFGPLYQKVSNCRCCFIDGTEETIRATVISIIEAYEDGVDDFDEEEEGYEEPQDLYNKPNFPVQMNKVEKVLPTNLFEGERDVYVLLASVPESDCLVLIPDHSITVPLKKICERLMSFQLPADINGEINFQLMSQGRIFAFERVYSHTKLDLIQNILSSEVNPQALIATALGLDKDDVKNMDTALAFKLQELAPVITFKTLCPWEDSLKNTDEPSNKMWPTLLHLAADLNLPLFCSELLRYPGMVAAACTENKTREFPSQIAARKGHSEVENDLMDFMKHWRREVDPDYFSSASSSSKDSSMSTLVEPLSSWALNKPDGVGSSTFYSEAQGLRKPLLDLNQPRSSPDQPSARAPVRSKSDRSETCRSRMSYSQRPLPRRPDSPTEENKSEDTHSNPDDSLLVHDSPRSTTSGTSCSPTSAKALKRLGATEEQVRNSAFIDPKLAAQFSATCPPGVIRTQLFLDDDEEDRLSYSSNCEESGFMGWNSNTLDAKKNQVKDKVKGFFQKIKGSKKTGSQLDLSGKKITKPRRGSEPANSTKHNKPRDKSYSMSEERDSGSYSDEEKKHLRMFKESNKPMHRRTSRRIAHAITDAYHQEDAPQLPAISPKRSTFKSFIDKP